ncbi:MAG TPA: cyclodeaminase/cyclohydrolase family protein [Candidatus Saccharimonadales bacterium]|nr:cyclodeaminase/cyclohydrolase family protein [Candidatus Saccharimonadales bacterium]
MKDSTLKDFLRNLGNRSPAPGGGAVSAINGALASAQLKMVCEYTKDESVKNNAEPLARKTDKFLGLAEEDAEAFESVSNAYKTGDKTRIDTALAEAVKVSSGVLADCEEVLELCEKNYEKFNRKLNADVITALANLRAAVLSSQAMIRTNKNAFSSEPNDLEGQLRFSDELKLRIDRLTESIEV